MKNIGIISLYYSNCNYGGQLQAYALCKAIQKLGAEFHAEQMCYIPEFVIRGRSLKYYIKKYRNPIKFIKKVALSLIPKVVHRKSIQRIESKKQAAFADFSDNFTPHSEIIYTPDTIAQAVEHYNYFITGSDQVWSSDGYDPSYFLGFVPSERVKLSYAASIGKSALTEAQKAHFRKYLADFKAVSVREADAVELLKPLIPQCPELVLDPTLLLDKDDWDEICSENMIKGGGYIFCYFLGDNPKERKLAKAFAKKRGLKVVSIPWIGTPLYSDIRFGDLNLPDASPNQFISLIKYAKYVFTDSFHALVFSHIYEKQYYIFNRDREKSMNSRIKSLMSLLRTEDRLCDTAEQVSLRYLESLPDIDYTAENDSLKEMRETSWTFLRNNLSD